MTTTPRPRRARIRSCAGALPRFCRCARSRRARSTASSSSSLRREPSLRRAHANTPAARSRRCARTRRSRARRSASASEGVALADRDHRGLLAERADVDVAARLRAQRFERRVEVLVERNLHRDLRGLLRAPDREVADGIRGQLLVRDHEPRVVVGADERVRQPDLLDRCPRRRRRSTRSPSRSGCENAIRIPAIAFPSVRCAAKPMTSPITADEARMPPAIARTCGMTSSAESTPTKTIVAHHDAADDAVARRRLRRELAAGSAPCRRASRDERRRDDDRGRDRGARCQKCMGGSYSGSRRLASCEAFFQPVPVCNLRPRRAASRAAPPRRRARAGKSTRPVSRSLTIAPRSWIAFTQRAISTRSRRSASSSSASAPESIPPPLPAMRCASASRSACSRCCSRRCATSSSTSGRISRSASFASLGREAAWHVAPMIRTSWSPVNDSSSGPRPATSCRRGGRRARRSRSSSGRGSRSGLRRSSRSLTLEPMRNPKAGRWDDPALTHDLGAVTDVWARWDSVHFLRIAEHGYSTAEAAFYPLYPALVAARRPRARRPLRRSPASSSRCSRRSRRSSCWSGSRRNGSAPTAAAGPCSTSRSSRRRSSSRRSTRSRSSSSCRSRAFVLAERGRFAWAGVVVGLAVLTRPTGLALVPPLILHRARPFVAARDGAAVPRRVPAAAVARRRRPVGVRARGGNVAPAPLAGRAARRDLGRRARGVGGRRAARVGIERARLLDRGRAGGLGAAPHGGAQPRALRLPRALRRARRHRVAASSARRTGSSRR